jgi:hypothetical protein
MPSALRAAPEAAKPLFATDTPVHLTIKGPISRLAGGSRSGAPVPATLTVDGPTPETLSITLAARGITRRATDVCQFPPLRVEFPDKPGAASLFAGQRKLKLVTHCKSQASFQQYLLLEYTTYKLFNLLTPISFDARLASIDYVDPDGKVVASRLGFFLEDSDDVARRNGLRGFKAPDRINAAQLDPDAAARESVFQYMIGNLDWSMIAGPAGAGCCHNTKLIGAAGATSGLIPLAYDYDFSGLVDAPYATPPQGIPVANVRVRRYRGFCAQNTQARAIATDWTAKRAALLAVYDTIPQLEDAPKRKAEAYLGGFFDGVTDPSGKWLKTCVN